jgi:iturin family lipopeptide synthetase A
MGDDEGFDDTAVAIVGMAGRFPGAADYRELWRNVSTGIESIRTLSPADLDALDVPAEVRDQPDFVPRSAVLDGPDLFDAEFFDVQPREAARMDPQHRVFLECAWHALEDAGYDPGRLDGPVGLYAGATLSSYLLFNIAPHHLGRRSALLDEFQLGVANSADFLVTRVAYKLNLTGPAITVLTGCSSSLVAVHLAAQSLLCGENDLVLAGGVSIQVNNRGGYVYTPDGIASADGHCRPFDAKASGTVFGSGVGVVVLKRLADALADGDDVRAVLRGSATNNDGNRKAGYVAPSVSGQAKVIVQALAGAGVSPETLGYVQAHGTATSVGDAIEVEALTKAFRTGTDRARFCALGSVKANVGHLDAAAGVTGLITAVLAVQHGQIPPVVGHSEPAEVLDGSPFFVNTELARWPVAGPRRAAVSSFGVGGTNAHVVVEQAEPRPHETRGTGWQALVLSARSPRALAELAVNLRAHLAAHPELDLADVAYTLRAGRHVFDHRRAVLCRDLDEAVRALAGEVIGRDDVRDDDVRHDHVRDDDMHHERVRDEAGERLAAIAWAWEAGDPVEWPPTGPGRRVPLPGYPFQRESFWIDPPRSSAAVDARTPHPEPGPSTLDLVAALPRRDVRADVVRILSTVSGRDPSDLATDVTFFQLGLDSLALVEAGSTINREFGVRVPIRQMFEQLPTIDALAAYLGSQLPEPEVEAATPDASVAVPSVSVSSAAMASLALPSVAVTPVGDGALEALMAQQLELLRRQAEIQHDVMTGQLRVLGGQPAPARPRPSVPASPADRPHQAAAFVPFKPAQVLPDPLTPVQRAHVEEFTAAYTRRTRTSKEITARSRTVRANHRNALNFRPMWKELVYPIFATGGQGAHITDVDGNTYVDLAMSFGATLIGHGPRFVTEAIDRELTAGQGLLIGPCTPHAEPVARLVSELTGVPRVAFFNSGTEAVMLALRLARAATGRSRIAIFAGSFHGTYDGTLVKPSLTDLDDVMPIAPGLLPALTQDVLVLPYCDPAALDLVREHGDSLAAVLVEPVQSRNPAPDPGPFLRELRRVTEEVGAALVFDETITGFRLHPGGAQALFGVRADIVTYGKVAGAGMPLGIVAGKPEFLDSVDGGAWSFGDDSIPAREGQRTFLGGTFCEHPLTMVAARALLEHFRAEGGRLHDRLEATSARLEARLRDVFAVEEVPIVISRRASIFRLFVPSNLELFYYHLIHRGVYFWEGRTWFLCDAHTDADLDHIVTAARESVIALREGGFLPPKKCGARPMTQDQRRMWFQEQAYPGRHNESARISITGDVDVAALCRAVDEVVRRHEALRTGFGPDGETRVVHRDVRVEVAVLGETDDDWWVEQTRTPFQLEQPPLLRAFVVERDAERHDLVVVAHQLALDGWSWSVVLSELVSLYTGVATPEPPVQFQDFVRWQGEQPTAAALEYWRRELADPPAPLVAPGHRPGRGGRVRSYLDPELRATLARLAREHDCTVSIVLLACFQLFVHGLTGRREFFVAVPSAGQAAMGAPNLVGQCTNVLPVRARIEPGETFADLVRRVRTNLSAAYDHQEVSLSALAADSGSVPVPPISVLFNVDRRIDVPTFAGFAVEVESGPVLFARTAVSLNVIEIADRLRLDLDHDTELFDGSGWSAAFADLIAAVAVAPASPVQISILGSPLPSRRPLTQTPTPQERDRVGPESDGADRVGPGPDEVERVVIEQWCAEFEEPVGLHSDFFDLGGTSLQATRLLSRVERQFGVRVPLAELFHRRTPADLATLLRVLRPEAAQALLPAPRDAPHYPLSFGQLRLWFVEQLGAQGSYVLYTATRLRGPLDRVALRAALDAVVRRHEVLHTVFREIDGEPVQVIVEASPVPFVEVDLAGVLDQAAALRDHCRAESDRPFDLGVAPLLRASLLRFEPDDHVVVLAMHHIIADGWSLDVLLREAAARYAAAATGEPATLPEPSVQYLDYALWQHQWLLGPDYRRQLEYWRRELDGAPLVLELPTDRPRPVVQTFVGASHDVRLPADVTEAAHRFVSAEKVSLFCTTLAAFCAVLGLYSGRDEVLVGTPSANRHRIEVEPLIGFFVNLLVIRAAPGRCDSFPELARQVQERVLAANANQDLPFERLVDEVLDGREASTAPIFQVMFVLNEMPPAQRVAGIELSRIRIERTVSRFDLTLSLEDSGKDLLAVFEYNTDLFDRATIDQLATRYVAFLRGALGTGS